MTFVRNNRISSGLARFLTALSAGSPPWLMAQSERMALLGILHLIKPKLVLEIGANQGGCTRWLSSLSERVYSVDIVNKLAPSVAGLGNLTVFTMDSGCAFDLFAQKNEQFDLIIIDGDHSREGSRRDTVRALECGSLILCHDSYNPACRQGFLDAVASTGRQVYFNPDFVQGTIHEGELWGG
ncbi:MAG: class I SAM-dependent methyltransferase, partial [Chitinispirillaceae bacterium]|nr:class I SAM-dependent methyltransferase [Chitinispirillaceae bacterium]